MGTLVRFKSYVGLALDGKPVVYDCSDFGARDLVEMLSQPKDLEAVNWVTGHTIWGERVVEIFQEEGGAAVAHFHNQGFARALATLGYRVVPEPHEIVLG